jgi:hypothetical protein
MKFFLVTRRSRAFNAEIPSAWLRQARRTAAEFAERIP